MIASVSAAVVTVLPASASAYDPRLFETPHSLIAFGDYMHTLVDGYVCSVVRPMRRLRSAMEEAVARASTQQVPISPCIDLGISRPHTCLCLPVCLSVRVCVYGCVYNESDIVKHALLTFTYILSARMSDYVYTQLSIHIYCVV